MPIYSRMRLHRVYVIAWVLALTLANSVATGINNNIDTCTGYDFSANCGPNEIILMKTAAFGRMGPGKCISSDKGNFGCTNDVMFLVDKWCSGRNDCQFHVPNSDIMEANTDCVEVFAFLRSSYECIQVNDLSQESCSSTSPNVLHDAQGLLSSHVTDTTGCGSARSPWVIQAKAGQIVEISLLDFKALDRARSQSLVTCADVYGVVVEKTLNINQTICGQTQRDSVLYRSKTNTVEIVIAKATGANFLIKYSANGCSDPTPPTHAWYKRNGHEAVIGCETNDREWRLTCNGNKWSGQTGNCTTGAVPAETDVADDTMEFELSTVVIVAGIIGGTVVLAVAVIVCGVVYIQKYKDRQEKQFNESQAPEMIPSQQCTAAHFRSVSSKVVEGQDDYLQPNTNTHAPKQTAKTDEPLIHIWETPLPDPNDSHALPQSRECTIHRNSPITGRTTQNPPGSKQTTMTKNNVRTGTSYYSPNTGHKYYVLDRESQNI